MSISDPAQLLQRVPELEALVDDSRIRKAIESGDPFKVYRALVWAKWLRRLPQHRDTVKLLVGHRRLFAKHLKRSPSLGTVNSVGFSFVGEAESDTDGSHIALHALVVLFAVPIVPLGAYLVRSTGERQWSIFARVPMGLSGWLYSRGLATGLLATLLVGAVSSYHKSQTQDIIVLNSLPVAVDVELDGKKQTVPADGRATINVAAGQVKGSATAGKSGVVDSYDHQVRSQGGYVFWNIAGASPLLRETISYYRDRPETPPSKVVPSVYCGERYVEMPHADFFFEEPAEHISMSKHDSEASRSHVEVAHQGNSPPLELCKNYLFSTNQPDKVVPLYEVRALLSGWDVIETSAAVRAASEASKFEAVRIAMRASAARPDDIDVHRLYQKAREDAGEYDALLKEYAEQAAQQPNSAKAQYLYAALLKGSQGLDKMESVAKKFGNEPHVLRSLTWHRTNAGNYAAAMESYQRLQKVAPDIAVETANSGVQALVAQNRLREALDLITASFHAKNAGNKMRDAGNFAMVARMAGSDPLSLLAELPSAEGAANDLEMVRVRAGLEPQHAATDNSRTVSLAMALRKDPAQAFILAHAMTRGELFRLQKEQLALLYFEAVRTQDKTVPAQLA
ncbi:tetratricopeptide repeat protein, partial [Undibacterium sp.]|uniref:tetratricopeptide repeat protein n=1 Tax=Undibacterium sp. TaxID=1914977 RepID=UPI00374CE764